MNKIEFLRENVVFGFPFVKDEERKKSILRQLVSHWMAEAEEIKEMIQVTTVHQKVESEKEDEEMMATATKDLCLIQ